MSHYDDMSTEQLSYHRSEIAAQIKPYLFVRLTDTEKSELRVLKKLLEKIDRRIKARRLRLPGF